MVLGCDKMGGGQRWGKMGQNGLVNSHIATKQHCTNYQNH